MDLKPKILLKRVVDFALAEIERRSRPPPRFSPAPSPDPADAQALGPQVPRPARLPTEAVGVADAASDADMPLELSRAASGALLVRWSLHGDDVAAARPLAAADARLGLRVVSFSADDKARIRREVLDLPAVALTGHVTLEPPAGERLVVSVGLLGDEQFVSIVHAQLV